MQPSHPMGCQCTVAILGDPQRVYLGNAAVAVSDTINKLINKITLIFVVVTDI